MQHCGTQYMETERLILRPFREDDGPAMYAHWASDPKVTKFLSWKRHESEDTSRQICRQFAEEAQKPNGYLWCLTLKEPPMPIGSITVHLIDEAVGRGEIGYCIGQSFWNQGFTTEALKKIVEFCFCTVGFQRLEAWHDKRNSASGRVMEKCGLVCEGVLCRSRLNNQGICDAVVRAVLRDEWLKTR